VEILRGKDRKTLSVKLEKAKEQKLEVPQLRSAPLTPRGLDEDGFENLRRDMEERFRDFQDRDNSETVPPVREGKAQLGISVAPTRRVRSRLRGRGGSQDRRASP